MTDSEKLDLLLSKVMDMESDITDIKQKVTSIEMTIENEMQVNIMRIAEGHIDLSRNLAEIKRNVELLDGKMEMNDLYIRHHDSEIKKLKAL